MSQHVSVAALSSPRALRPLLRHLPAPHLLHIAALALWLLALRIPRILYGWYARARQRAALAYLDQRLLRDVGVTPEQARRECAKWFWQR